MATILKSYDLREGFRLVENGLVWEAVEVEGRRFEVQTPSGVLSYDPGRWNHVPNGAIIAVREVVRPTISQVIERAIARSEILKDLYEAGYEVVRRDG